jgi:phospholipase/carboxylesterase
MELVRIPLELHLLPVRFGPRPRATGILPFRQIDQLSPIELTDRLFTMCLDLPGVRSRQSRLASPQTRALCLVDGAASGPPEAFIDAREFCHLHTPPSGSIHLTLPAEAIEGVVALGWAERHPIQNLGLHPTLVMVYGPRDSAELEVVFCLIEHSLRFARGARHPIASVASIPAVA